MNYKESSEILEEIEKANRVLVNCHRTPDGDSVGSAVAMAYTLEGLGKEVLIICVDDIPSEYLFLDLNHKIKKIDYHNFNFSDYDLFMVLDSSTWSQVSADKDLKIPEIEKIIIDHHFTNDKFGKINLIDADRSSTAEILYGVFEDWKVNLSKEIAEGLLTGVVYDTSALQHPSADVRTAEIFVELMRKGADKDKIIRNIYRTLSFDKVKAAANILQNLQIDKDNKFVWSAISFEDYKKFQDAHGVKTMVANMFGSSIEGTDFGMIMVEESEKSLNVSFRGRTDFDTSLIAGELGGGGHKKASAVRVEGLSFDQAVEKVLTAARKYSNKSK